MKIKKNPHHQDLKESNELPLKHQQFKCWLVNFKLFMAMQSIKFVELKTIQEFWVQQTSLILLNLESMKSIIDDPFESYKHCWFH